jgi:hypothetical protein
MPVCYSVSPAKYVLTSDEAGGARPRGMPAHSPPYFTLLSCTARRIPASVNACAQLTIGQPIFNAGSSDPALDLARHISALNGSDASTTDKISDQKVSAFDATFVSSHLTMCPNLIAAPSLQIQPHLISPHFPPGSGPGASKHGQNTFAGWRKVGRSRDC